MKWKLSNKSKKWAADNAAIGVALGLAAMAVAAYLYEPIRPLALYVFLVLLGLGLMALAVSVYRYNRVIRLTKRRINDLDDVEFSEILDTIDMGSPDISDCCILVDTGRDGPSNGSFVYGTDQPIKRSDRRRRPVLHVVVPDWMTESPWRGECLDFVYEDFKVTSTLGTPGVHGQPLPDGARALRPVRVPRVLRGKTRYHNLFDAGLLVKGVPGLKAILAKYSDRPADFLALTLHPTTWGLGSEVFDRIQIGGHPRWVQDSEHPKCTVCRRSMTFIMLFGSNASSMLDRLGMNGVVYAFGCESHPDQTVCIEQST